MARNSINEAVASQERTGVERLRETGRLGYRAASYQAAPVDDSLSKAFRNFSQSAADMYGSYRQVQKSKADERSNEIIRKLTPEQRRAAMANGTLLYQDDPDAMMALRFKSGRSAAFEVETEIQNKIQLGEFKDRQSLIEYRKTRLEDKARAYAEGVGIDHNDEDYQRGFNSDILEREAAIYDTHARKLSEQTQAIAQMETTSDLGSMFSDEGFLRSPGASAQFANYITASLASGAIPTESMAVSAMTKAIADNAAQPGADVFMDTIGDQEVLLYGRPMKVRDIVGPEVLENYKVKAGEAAFKRNRHLQQEFTFGIQNALAQADPHAGLQQIAALQTELYKRQPTDMVTTQSEQLNAARGRLLGMIGQDSANRAKEIDKQLKSDNKLAMFEAKYQQRIAGETVSTDFRTYETDPAQTGDFKEEDAANFAMKKLSDIDRMGIPQETKDKLKLQYLRADFADGPFRKHFQTLTTDAVNQYNGLVISQMAEINDQTTGRIRDFQRIYQSDPATIAALYPEQAALAERVSLMERSGIDIEVMVDADRKAKGLTHEEQRAQEKKWSTLFNGTDSAVPYLPGNLRTAARTLFDSEVFRTGDEGAAKATVNEWLSKSVVQFETKRADGEKFTVGAVQKRTLMVDPEDATSWRKGQEILNERIRQIAGAKPWVSQGDITVTETPQGLRINDSMGSMGNLLVTPEMLRKEWEVRRDAEQAQAVKDLESRSNEKINQYKTEQQRRKASPFSGLDSSTGTLEGAMGFEGR